MSSVPAGPRKAGGPHMPAAGPGPHKQVNLRPFTNRPKETVRGFAGMVCVWLVCTMSLSETVYVANLTKTPWKKKNKKLKSCHNI